MCEDTFYSSSHVRLNAEFQLTGKVSQTDQITSLRDLYEIEVAAIVAPDHLFVFSGDVALEVNSPQLFFLIQHANGPERDLDLEHPPLFSDVGGHTPVFIPVGILTSPLLRDPGVKLGSQGVGAKEKPILSVVKGVQDDLEGIVGLEGIVPSPLFGDDSFRFRVVTDHANVKSRVGVDNLDLGFFGGRLAFPGITLKEVRNDRHLPPERLIQIAIQNR